MAPSFSLVWVHSNGLNWKMQVPSGRTNPTLATSRPDCFPMAFLSSSMNESLAVIPQIFHRAGRFHSAVHAGCRLNIHIIHQPPQAAAHWLGKQWQSVCRLTAPGAALPAGWLTSGGSGSRGKLSVFSGTVFSFRFKCCFMSVASWPQLAPNKPLLYAKKNVSDYRLFFQNLKFYQKIS